MFKRILVPTDGSDITQKAVETAIGVARALNAPLHTVVMSVLAPIFLACAGLRVDLTALADPPVLLAGCCVSHAGFMTLVYYEAASGKVYSMNAGWNSVRKLCGGSTKTCSSLPTSPRTICRNHCVW